MTTFHKVPTQDKALIADDGRAIQTALGLNPISRPQWNAGYSMNSGPFRGGGRKRTFRPEKTFPPTTPQWLTGGALSHAGQQAECPPRC
jgi:hypothetical protein